MRRSLAFVTLAALLAAPLPADASRTPAGDSGSLGKITADGRTYLTDDDGGTAPGAEPALGAYARRVAGLPVAESYDAAARTLTLTYTTRRGVLAPTEIAVPREFFPRGVRVKVSGVRAAVTSQRDGLLKVAVGARPGTAVTVTVSPR